MVVVAILNNWKIDQFWQNLSALQTLLANKIKFKMAVAAI